MRVPLPPFLLAAELLFLFAVFQRGRPGKRFPPPRLAMFWLWLVAYSAIATTAGFQGIYVSEALLRTYPGFWLQLVTVVACVAPVLGSSQLRSELGRAVDATGREPFIYFHMLRLAALGTLVGASRREFPVYFEILVGLPDLAYALSTFWVLGRVRADRLSDRQFLLWNLTGALVIVPAAPILLQLGLPGPLQVFTGQPDARAVFEFPMSIASVIGVPLLVLVNLLVAWRLLEKRKNSTTEMDLRPCTAGAVKTEANA